MPIDDPNHAGSTGRRDFLKTATALGVGAGLTIAGAWPSSALAKPVDRKRVLRVAHLTDVHLYPDRGAPQGMASCLKHVRGQADKPALILFGGDHIMDAFDQNRERTQFQWNLWKMILAAESSLPYKACIGNHDIWGWNKGKSQTTGNEPGHGKKWAVETLGLPGRYYSFDQAGWHFIALDSVQAGKEDGTYSAFLDDEQLDWLTKDLERTPATTPTLIWSHVPIVSAMPMLAKRPSPTGELTVSPGTGHTDAGKLVELLARHPEVKACLSGHLHLVDHVQIKGINFHCNGAVCGSWWKGKNNGFEEGYTLLDLYDDGTYTNTYVPYGWTAQPALMNLE